MALSRHDAALASTPRLPYDRLFVHCRYGVQRASPGLWRRREAKTSEERMGSVIKKRRKKIRKHKYRKLRKRMRHSR